MPSIGKSAHTTGRASSAQADTPGGTTTSPLLKFFIGFFAAICAVFLPKLVTFLQFEGENVLKPPSTAYMIAGVVFALIIGVGALLFEWGKRSKPGEIFMTALGIPALVSGTLGTVGSAGNLAHVVEGQRAEMEQLRRTMGLAIGEDAIPAGQLIAPLKTSAIVEFLPSAHAAERGSISVAQSAFGVQAVRRQFVVAVLETNDERRAIERANELRPRLPNAAVVPIAGRFYVVASTQPLSEAEALAQAYELRKENVAPAPKLVPVK